MFWAPGVNIAVEPSGGGYLTSTGTSDSAAMVSGAIAVMRSAAPQLTVDQIIAALQATGTRISDPASGTTLPLIQLEAAISSVVAPPIPSSTATALSTSTLAPTSSPTASSTGTATVTATSTFTPTLTSTATATITPTDSTTTTPTVTSTGTATPTTTSTSTVTPHYGLDHCHGDTHAKTQNRQSASRTSYRQTSIHGYGRAGE